MASSGDTSQAESPLSATRWLAEVALLFLIFFVMGGEPVPHFNESHYLVKARHYWNPQWCAGDLFLESADAHLVFYWTVGVLTKWLSLPAVAWIGRCAAWAALAFSWHYLSWGVLPRRWAALFSALLFVILRKYGHFAGEWVVGGVEAKCFAYALVFSAWGAICRRRWNAAWMLLGLGTAFHALVGAWAILATAVVWFRGAGPMLSRLRSQAPAAGVGALIALLGVVPGLLLSAGVPPEIRDQANQIYVFFRLPHHLAPLSLPIAELAWRAGVFALLVTALAVSAPRPGGPARAALAKVRLLAWASLGFWLAGLVWEIVTWNHAALAACLLKYYWFRLADVAVPLALSFTLIAQAFQLATRSDRREWWYAACVGLPAVLLMLVAVSHWLENSAPADRKLAQAAAWREACFWLRDHTPPDALCLIPRTGQSFKWHAQRPDYCNYKDIPQDARSIVEWYDRCQSLYYYEDAFGKRTAYRGLGGLGTQRIRQLCRRENVQFVVAEEYPPLLLPVVHENDWYKIYQITAD